MSKTMLLSFLTTAFCLNGCAVIKAQSQRAQSQRQLSQHVTLIELPAGEIERLGGQLQAIPWGAQRSDHLRLADDTPVLTTDQDASLVGVAADVPGPVSLLQISPDLHFWRAYPAIQVLPAYPRDLEVINRKTLLYAHGKAQHYELLQIGLENASEALSLGQQVRDFYALENIQPETSLLAYESRNTNAQYETHLRLYSPQNPQGQSLLTLPAAAGVLQAVAWPRSDRLYLQTRAERSSGPRFWRVRLQ